MRVRVKCLFLSLFLFNLLCAIMSLIYRLAGSYLGNVQEVFHGILQKEFLTKFIAPKRFHVVFVQDTRPFNQFLLANYYLESTN